MGLSPEFVGNFLENLTKIYKHGKTFLTLSEEKENLSKEILQIRNEYNIIIKEKDKTISENKRIIKELAVSNLQLSTKNSDLLSNINNTTRNLDEVKEELLKQNAKNEELTETNLNYVVQLNTIKSFFANLNGRITELESQNIARYNNTDNNNKEHEFITCSKQLLNQHISQYRKIINQQKQNEIDKLSGEIIKYFIKVFHFTPLEDLDDLELCWVLNESKIDPEFMEGQWEYDKVDDYVVEICRFPLIRTPKKIYSLAEVFVGTLDNSNTRTKSDMSLEIIKLRKRNSKSYDKENININNKNWKDELKIYNKKTLKLEKRTGNLEKKYMGRDHTQNNIYALTGCDDILCEVYNNNTVNLTRRQEINETFTISTISSTKMQKLIEIYDIVIMVEDIPFNDISTIGPDPKKFSWSDRTEE
ncbi:11482_t:CDS:2 [Entrophospora sp. SA101]|nr:11482_t:CDS:2 [Entrophospora sp. SA101]